MSNGKNIPEKDLVDTSKTRNYTQPNLLRQPILSAPIQRWKAYDEFMKKQLEHKNIGDMNIQGLACKKTYIYRTRTWHISFSDSEFERMEQHIKKLYDNSIFAKTRFEGIRKRPSLLQIFQSSGPAVYFPEYLLFDHVPTVDTFLDADDIDVEKLYDGFYDKNIKEEWETVQKNKTGNVFSILNEYGPQIMDILRLCNSGKRVCTMNFGTKLWGPNKQKTAFHALGSIFWKRQNGDKRYVCAIYDPMYSYHQSFDLAWSLKDHYVTLKLLSFLYGIQITILNLGDFCTGKLKNGIFVRNCPQYMIDASYCNMYVLYFFYCYGKHNFPIHNAGFQSVINDTFIVKPEELTRDNCRATNEFRVRMMSFILIACTLLSENKPMMEAILRTYRDVYRNGQGYILLPQDIRLLLNATVEELKRKGAAIEDFQEGELRVPENRNVKLSNNTRRNNTNKNRNKNMRRKTANRRTHLRNIFMQ